FERDFEVLTQTLHAAYVELMPDGDVAALSSSDASLLMRASTHEQSREPTLHQRASLASLLRAKRALQRASVVRLRFSDILKSHINGYRAARRQLRHVLSQPSPTALHELRKRVKDQLYQTRLLVNLGKDAMRDSIEAFERLAELLGEYHDIANLRLAVEHARSDARRSTEQPGLWHWTTRRSSQLEAEALALAGRLLAESARSRRKRLRALYEALSGRDTNVTG
ncbi:MAG TPA: CHAD domain-containing protein, partial [Polyangiaceae bacterium]